MYTVRNLLQHKGNNVWYTRPDATILEALEEMADKDIGAMLVMNRDRLVGIFSERDYARKVVLQGKSSRDTQVHEVMTTRVAYVTPDQTVAECMALMTEGHFRHLPVIEDNQVVGVISIGDVVKATIGNQEFVITQLERYITGETVIRPATAL